MPRSDTQKRIQLLLGKNKPMNFSQLQKEIGIFPYDSHQINYGSADLMCSLLFGKNVLPEEIQWDLAKGWSYFFKKNKSNVKR